MNILNIRLKFFASIREGIGHSDETLQTSSSNVGQVRDELIARGGVYADMLSRDRVLRCAFNHTMVSDDTPISEGGEVAFFPPVTGG